tara:strand:+ start:254 stop:517 length:264 start_codon:yes stop_codon:yes gene_type:complete
MKWILVSVYIFAYPEGYDAGKNIIIDNDHYIFDTEEDCHNHLRWLHRKVGKGTLNWTQSKQLYVLFDDNTTRHQCVYAEHPAPDLYD